MTRINLLTGRLLSGGRRIPLSQAQSAVVDDEDFERINRHRWCAWWSSLMGSFYAQRRVQKPDGSWTSEKMHREVMNLEPGDGKHVDHINGADTLDNRKENLRVVTPRQNHENRRNQSKWGVGVRRRPSGRFAAEVHWEGKSRTLGTFDTPQEATDARTEFLASHGEEVLERHAEIVTLRSKEKKDCA